MITIIGAIVMATFSLLGGAWNMLGDTAALVFGWISYFVVSTWLWRLPGVPEETVILLYWSIPATIGFLVEHLGPFVTQALAVKHIGIPGANGAVTPFTIPPITNVVIWIIWDLLLYVFSNYFIPVIVVGGGIFVIVLIRARRSHP